jgi:hypothetical protein
MSYTPKHAKPTPSKDGKAGSPGSHHALGVSEAYAGRHTAPGGKPRRAPRTEVSRRKVAA